jgi:hypothetical protein
MEASSVDEESTVSLAACAGNQAHRWRIEEATAAVSSGVCGHCGAERVFKNERKPGDLSHPVEDERRVLGRGRGPTMAFRS